MKHRSLQYNTVKPILRTTLECKSTGRFEKTLLGLFK